ncbi:unnamed protein product [Adineta steineri]|uniref:Protein translocase subunit SecA n=1 Tax=Adineta steineri TaxID=433720 RepID=A0A814JA41_9BILA|nr:unnamed protein product [Adineta steineri]CAF3618502.1 unnamed protein product [Adineta steineri]
MNNKTVLIVLGPEETLKSLIFQWFESGEMSLETWREWSKWFIEGVKLCTLKVIRWPKASPGDVVQLNFLKALKSIPTDDFQEKDGLIAVLKLYLQEPEIKIDENGTTLNVVGRIIFLSSVKKRTEEVMQKKNILQVDIFARDVFHIDADLEGKYWQGKNLCVVTDKVNVWGDRIIDVSGSGYEEKDWKAQNGEIGCDGTNGKDGHPGESSGNIAIMTKDISNPQKLKLLLNGGNGENGQNGGDGGDGANGKGVTENELTAACVKYDSLYRTNWSHFSNYEPENWTRTLSSYNYSKEYLYYEYIDSDKRTMIYSLASYAGWTYSWYELFVWINGTDGTAGGVGGRNGCGGEGGNQGECNVINPDTGVEFTAVNIIKNPGRNGTDGTVGECGKSGSNGNHMAVIDRSASGTNKFFYGEKSATRLKMEYYVKSDTKRRINGYRKHVEGESSIFGEFEFQDIPQGGVRKTKQKQKQERSTEAQTTMKKSIVLNKLWQKAAEHTAQLDGALATAMVTVKSTATANFEIEESLEEEESTEQEQEVVVVKEVNEDSLEIRRTRAKKSNMMPAEFLNSLLAKKSHESACGLVQEVITYFLIEFSHTDLNRASIPMLLRCSRIRQVMENPFKKTLVGAVQNKREGGLTLTELENLSKQASQKRQLKRLITKHRNDVSNYADYCQTAEFNTDSKLTPKDDKIYNVKFVEPALTALWNVNIDQKEVVAVTKKLFNDYLLNEVDGALLLEIQKTRNNLKTEMEKHLKNFGQHQINWADKETWEAFKTNLTEEKTEIKTIMKAISGLKIKLTNYFEEYAKLIADKSMLEKAKTKVQSGGSNELESRFGKVPKFHNGVEKNLEATHFLIRFYHQMKRLLEFNRILMIVNLIYHAETTKAGLAVIKLIKSYQTLTLDKLVLRIENAKINLESNLAEEYMRAKGFHSAAFRYLVAELNKMNIEIYGNEDYGNVELLESWNPSGEKLVRIAFDGNQYYDLAADSQLRQLIAARSNHSWKKNFKDYRQRLSSRPWDYTTSSTKNDFASYFPSGFVASIYEWVDCYVASTNDHNFLKMLHERFELDGNHLGIADFQFLISTAILIQSQYHVSPDFLLNLASSVPQIKLVDTFFIARIESQWRRQLEHAFGISELLNRISVSRLKILFATKLDGQKIKEKTLTKLLVMLSCTSTNNKQLEKMNLSDWITMAEKQKYFTFSNEIMEFANIGYYIIYLKQQDRQEAAKLEEILTSKDREFHIPEQIIAQVCSLIMHNEVVFDDNYIIALITLLQLATKYSKLPKTGKHEFICDELEQRKIIEKIKDESEYKTVITEKPRTLETITELIKGVHDTEDERKERHENSKKMATLLRNPSGNDSVKHLMKIDAAIKNIFGVNLRETQKMAIIYAVESGKNFLSQVNTGEGKSYIVASIAIIRAQQFKSVDIITSSSVLAQRDVKDMRPLYEAMGLNVAHNCTEGLEDRKQAYKANVVYGEIGRFQRDHLLHDFYRKNILGDRERQSSCVIVDEVDNMLLDNGNNMLYLSHSVPGLELLESLFVHIQRLICSPTANRRKEEAFSTDSIEAHILSDLLGRISKEDLDLLALTSIAKQNCENVWDKLMSMEIIDSGGYLKIQADEDFLKHKQGLLAALKLVTTELHATKILSAIRVVVNRQREIPMPRYLIPFCRRHLREYIENAKRALFMNHNEAYVVDVDHTGEDTDITPKVTIIDQNTGVDLATSQWSEGLHQCIQIKHACRVSPISLKAVFVSNVFYLKEYGRINGLSGTLGSIEESKTLVELYNTDLIRLPTFRAKKLYEHVPVITQKVEDWIDAIYAEIVDQVTAKRSVLVICRSIADVMQVKNGLKERHLNDENASNAVNSCYENMIVYQREFDEFDFSGVNKLKPGRLILATNLAGRGTDIKLSDELQLVGGLHVIVSFLPANSRIEDQAYGRAARCGDPGSGQIIAITDKVDATGKPPSVFELKVFRDNAEVQRLQSMTDYYNYHTKIEESCLAAFKQHCLKALRKTSEKKSGTDVPTKEEIIYFALLDEWALWLDSQATAIKECAQERSAAKRGEIVASVEAFLNTHPIEPVETALKWVNAPQPLIALGLIYIDQQEYSRANTILDSVITKCPEFAGEAYYYKGIIEQQSVRKVKEIPKDIKQSITNKTPRVVINALSGNFANTTSEAYETTKKALKDWLPDNVCEIDDVQRIKAEDYLLQAIRTFNQRTENKETLHTIVSRLRKVVGSKTVASSGFQNQTEDLKTTLDCLSSSAYDMIGHAVSWQIFANMKGTLEEKYETQKQLKRFMEEGYVSPKTLNHNLLPQQCEALKSKYFLSKRKIQRLFKEQNESSLRVVFYNRTVLLPEEIKKSCKLPRREEFWGFMIVHQCFSTLNEFFVFDQTPGDGLIEELSSLSPVATPEPHQFRIQLSDFNLSQKVLYDAKQVIKAFGNDTEKLDWLESIGVLTFDASGIVDLNRYNTMTYLPNYDYFTDKELAEYLEIDQNEGIWIADELVNEGILQRNLMDFVQVNSDKTVTKDMKGDEKKLYDTVLGYEQLQKIDNINEEIVKAIITSINAKIGHNIFLKVSDEACENLEAILEDTQINDKTTKNLIIDSLNQPHNWKLFREAVREIERGFRVEKALKAVQKLDKTWKLASSEAMTMLLNSLLSKFVEDSIVSISDKMDSEIEISSNASEFNESTVSSDSSDSESDDEESNKNSTKFYIDLLYDRASKCVNEEIVAQAGKPLLETFMRYIEHLIESTDVPEGLNNYLDELTDDKYSIEERGKEVIALQTRLFVSNDLHQAVQKCYQKNPTEQLEQVMNQYNLSA